MDKLVIFLVFVLLGYHEIGGISKNSWTEMYYWKEVIFENLPFTDDTIIGKYPYHIPSNNDINGIDYHAASGLVFATVVRLRPGVPSTLNAFCASDYPKGSTPQIWGFPDYQKNTLKAAFYNKRGDRQLESTQKYSAGYNNFFFGNKSKDTQDAQDTQDDTSRKAIKTNNYYNYNDFNIIYTYYPTVDNICNRLYVVDAGTLRFSSHEIYLVQNPAILIYDLPTNGCRSRQFPLVRRVEIPSNLWKNPIGFTYITVDYQSKGSCDDVFLYLVNVFDNCLVVYNYKRGSFYSFTGPSMEPVYAESFVPFKNSVFYVPLGIGTLALGWPDKNGDRSAYFAPVSSQSEYVVSTKTLKSSKRAQYKDSFDDFTLIGYRGCESYTYKQVFDETSGIIFFAEASSHKITCWNTKLPISPDTIGVVFESELLVFVPAISIDSEGYLWFLTNHLPILYNTNESLNVTDVNSRAFRIKISEAIRGTVCDSSTYNYNNH